MKKLKLQRNHGDYLTAHDVLKTAALLFMILDHTGHFFYQDVEELRIIGRFSAPIWFFLIGYAGARKVPDSWWYGGGVLALSAAVIGGYILPLCILFMLALARLVIGQLDALAARGTFWFITIMLVLTVTAIPSTYILEYGTVGLIWALYGSIRRREKDGPIRPAAQAGLLTFMVAASTLFQALVLPVMGGGHYLALAAGMSVLFVVLQSFGPKTWPGARGIAVPILQFCGRWTLEIYVIHLLLFRIAAYGLYPEKYQFLQPALFMPSLT